MKYSKEDLPADEGPGSNRALRVGLALAALVIVGIAYLLLSSPGTDTASMSSTSITLDSDAAVPVTTSTTLAPAGAESPLTGLRVSEKTARLQPMAVVIENHPRARPQSGLSSADLVYEVVAEAGITRFLAIFQSTGAPSVGPVRSVRGYFADLSRSWGAALAHVGGAPSGYARMRALGVDDLDEFKNGGYYRRVSARRAPHNLYTSTASLRKLMNRKGMNSPPSANGLFFESPGTAGAIDKGGTTDATVSIDFSTSSYRVGWRYQPEAGVWKRSTAGATDTDALSGRAVQAANVVVIFTSIRTVDSKLRVAVDLRSGGKAYVFKKGRRYVAQWERSSGSSPISLQDPSGAPIALKPGVTWFEIVGKGRRVKYDPGG